MRNEFGIRLHEGYLTVLEGEGLYGRNSVYDIVSAGAEQRDAPVLAERRMKSALLRLIRRSVIGAELVNHMVTRSKA